MWGLEKFSNELRIIFLVWSLELIFKMLGACTALWNWIKANKPLGIDLDITSKLWNVMVWECVVNLRLRCKLWSFCLHVIGYGDTIFTKALPPWRDKWPPWRDNSKFLVRKVPNSFLFLSLFSWETRYNLQLFYSRFSPSPLQEIS